MAVRIIVYGRNTETSSTIHTVMVPLILSRTFWKNGIKKDKKLDWENGKKKPDRKFQAFKTDLINRI